MRYFEELDYIVKHGFVGVEKELKYFVIMVLEIVIFLIAMHFVEKEDDL